MIPGALFQPPAGAESLRTPPFSGTNLGRAVSIKVVGETEVGLGLRLARGTVILVAHARCQYGDGSLYSS